MGPRLALTLPLRAAASALSGGNVPPQSICSPPSKNSKSGHKTIKIQSDRDETLPKRRGGRNLSGKIRETTVKLFCF